METRRVYGWDKPMSNRLPVGPGSRGGTFDQDRAAYFRQWRLNHPEYMARERARSRRRKQRRADGLPMPTLTDVCAQILREDLESNSLRMVGRKLAIDHTTVMRITKGERQISGDTINAVVEAYTFDRIIQVMRLLRKKARRVGSDTDPVPAGIGSKERAERPYVTTSRMYAETSSEV